MTGAQAVVPGYILYLAISCGQAKRRRDPRIDHEILFILVTLIILCTAAAILRLHTVLYIIIPTFYWVIRNWFMGQIKCVRIGYLVK